MGRQEVVIHGGWNEFCWVMSGRWADIGGRIPPPGMRVFWEQGRPTTITGPDAVPASS